MPDLPLPVPHCLDHVAGHLRAELDPVRADVRVGLVVGDHVDLDDVDPGLLRLLELLGEELHVRIVDHEDVRLLADERGERLGLGLGGPVGILHLGLHAGEVRAHLDLVPPGLHEGDTHGHRKVGDRLALERVVRLVDEVDGAVAARHRLLGLVAAGSAGDSVGTGRRRGRGGPTVRLVVTPGDGPQRPHEQRDYSNSVALSLDHDDLPFRAARSRVLPHCFTRYLPDARFLRRAGEGGYRR